MSLNYSIGTATQYDNLPLLPAIGTINGGVRLNSNISMAVGAMLEFDGLKFNELTYAATGRVLTDSLDAVAPRMYAGCFRYVNVATSAGIAERINCTATPVLITTETYTSHIITATGISNLGTVFQRGSASDRGRCFSRQFRVKDSSGAVIYKWLDQVSDYKSTPPSASIVGTLQWYKLASDGDEINNYLTGTLLHNALIATPPTQPVTVYILDAGTDVSMLQAQYNDQPVTISREFLPKQNRGFSFQFGFNF